VLRQTYQPTATDAGDLRVVNSASDISNLTLFPPASLGDPATVDTTPAGICTYTESSSGVAWDTTPVPSDRLGVGVRDFDAILANELRPRITAGKQYRFVWKVTSTSNSNRNPHLRLQSRSLGFLWDQKFELGGALAGGSTNQAIAREALPGVGTEVTDGLYTTFMHSPLSAQIRASQPNIAGQPAFGSTSTSRRDVRVGFEVVDTLTGWPAGFPEKGNYRVERIDVYEGDLVTD
jgi:hypothetical protein